MWPRLRGFWLTGVPLLAAVLGCAAAPASDRGASGTLRPLGTASVSVTTRENVAYGPLPEQRGDLYLPASNGRRAHRAVVMIHGGGWVAGQRATNGWFSGLIAAKDFVVFNIDYRLAKPNAPETHWPVQLVDAQLAVRWLRANARELDIDPSRIGAVGDSAGGTLAIFLGTEHVAVPGDDAGLLADQRSDVAAVVDQFGITDLAALGDSAIGLVELLFGTRVPAPGLLESVSPLPGVSGRSAPMLLVHGLRDSFVPYAQAEHLAAALRSKGVSAQLLPYQGGHGFEGLGPEAVLATFEREIAWLEQHLAR